MHQWGFHRVVPGSSHDNDGHRLTPTHGDCDILDADCNRVAPDNPFVQHLDPRAFDEAKFDQPALSSIAESAESA